MLNLNLHKIVEIPTVVDNNHESLYRSYHTLQLVITLLEKGTPSEVVLAILRETEDLAHYVEQANKACSGQVGTVAVSGTGK